MFNANATLPTASVIKVPVLVAVVAQAETGRFALTDKLVMTQADQIYGSGILKELAPGLALTIHDAAVLMIIVSDNTATNLLIDLVGGPTAINEQMRSLGLASIALHQKLDPQAPVPEVKDFAEATPSDLCRLMELIADEATPSARGSHVVRGIMERQQHLDQIPRYYQNHPYIWELDTEQHPLRVASKTGFHPGTRCDIGIVTMVGGESFAYAAMTSGSTDASMGPEAEGAVTNGLLGRVLLEHWWPTLGPEPPILPSPYWDRAMALETTDVEIGFARLLGFEDEG